MGSGIAACLTVAVPIAWVLRLRRRPGWRESPKARFYIWNGCLAIVFAVYWLSNFSTTTEWAWTLGYQCAGGAVVSLVCGLNALRAGADTTP